MGKFVRTPAMCTVAAAGRGSPFTSTPRSVVVPPAVQIDTMNFLSSPEAAVEHKFHPKCALCSQNSTPQNSCPPLQGGMAWPAYVHDDGIADACEGCSPPQRVNRAALDRGNGQLHAHIGISTTAQSRSGGNDNSAHASFLHAGMTEQG